MNDNIQCCADAENLGQKRGNMCSDLSKEYLEKIIEDLDKKESLRTISVGLVSIPACSLTKIRWLAQENCPSRTRF